MKKPDKYFWKDNYRAISKTEYCGLVDTLMYVVNTYKGDGMENMDVRDKDIYDACKKALLDAGCTE